MEIIIVVIYGLKKSNIIKPYENPFSRTNPRSGQIYD